MNRNELPLAAFELHNGAVGNHRLWLLLFSLLFLLVLTLLLLRFAIVFIIFTDRGPSCQISLLAEMSVAG